MFSYENGLFVSFLFYCYYIFNLLMSINSVAEKNLNKVGERYSWLSLKPKLMRASDFDRPFYKSAIKFFFVVIWQGIFVFLSWLNVFINIGYMIYRYSQDSGAPQSVKDFRWKIKNSEMTFDELVLEVMKLKEIPIEEFDMTKAELLEFVEQRRLS